MSEEKNIDNMELDDEMLEAVSGGIVLSIDDLWVKFECEGSYEAGRCGREFVIRFNGNKHDLVRKKCPVCGREYEVDFLKKTLLPDVSGPKKWISKEVHQVEIVT